MRRLLLVLAAFLLAGASKAEEPWVAPGPDGAPQIQLYFFWSLTCPHCTAAHPHIEAIPGQRPWVRLHALEVSREGDNLRRYSALSRQIGAEPDGVPAWIFCGEMHTGWDGDDRTGAMLRERLDTCRSRLASGAAPVLAQPAATGIDLPFFGRVDPASLSLPALTAVLAALDAFNPCAFFVLLFLLSMMAHQKSRSRMLAIGGVFVLISGLMYFAFMAAWLNVFQVFGHLAWVTLAAGLLAVLVGAVNVKDFFWFQKGLTLSIPESKKPDIFRRTRAIVGADRMPAMLAATVVLAIAANFYELLCTAGFPMVFTRLLTLAELSPAGRYAYLAAYNLIYVLPLAAIVAVFAGTLGARKLTEREGRLLKLMSGLMMLGLGLLLLLAPERLSQVGIAFGLMALALIVTIVAARLTKGSPP
jgi:hypothetical protein